ncbi:hypothetical protein MOC16_gp094 [Klebsiella phage vB_KpM_FBKp24]|uniref:Uncharacterized protein n=1 Tax=Klebsiella phage vB_KpM_FBKp24 TaxID=2801834 RepID=A0A7U0GBE5_9CAUD|nr:hypothetical protein MOC16_gp094 [Klebsiella phage vB_KpM_FBKp24]QQV92119.1 hypothetical protein vBKpMFBKp24_319 [Klebsiella phage vB_KpM_FBKp24]
MFGEKIIDRETLLEKIAVIEALIETSVKNQNVIFSELLHTAILEIQDPLGDYFQYTEYNLMTDERVTVPLIAYDKDKKDLSLIFKLAPVFSILREMVETQIPEEVDEKLLRETILKKASDAKELLIDVADSAIFDNSPRQFKFIYLDVMKLFYSVSTLRIGSEMVKKHLKEIFLQYTISANYEDILDSNEQLPAPVDLYKDLRVVENILTKYPEFD